MNKVLAEYIWIDGTQPTPLLRSKTKVLDQGETPPIWGFDGSSTNQAEGHFSDCVLHPVASFPDPVRGGEHKLVLCEVLLTTMEPHPTNKRRALSQVAERFASQEALFGIEQEYNMKADDRFLGFSADGSARPQGTYYCGVGLADVFGRPLAEAHLAACLKAGISIAGINAEVMPGQWEYQIGPLNPLEVADQLWVARWLMNRIGEDLGIAVTIDPKPMPGDWNGAGAHTNFSTKSMRESYESVELAAKALGTRHEEHIKNYGHDIHLRLTGAHETASYETYSYGVSNRGASVRIPWQVAKDGRGYIEDRRPNANCDPYIVTCLILETCCLVLEAGHLPAV